MAAKKNKKIRVAVVGCGRWGRNHVRIFNGLSGSEMAFCCDRNRKRLGEIKSSYPHLKLTGDLKEVLSDAEIDAVVVATAPDNTHFVIGKKVLEANKHLFVEKPLALSLKQAEVLVQLARTKGKVLMTGHTYQYHPAIQKIKKLIQSGKTRPVSILSTRIELGLPPNRADADLLWSSAVHDVSIIQELLEAEPKKIAALQGSLGSKKLGDVLFVNLLFPSDIIAHIQAGFAGPFKERKLIIHSPQKIIVFDGITESLEVFSAKRPKAKARVSLRGYGQKFEKTEQISFKKENPLKTECQHFLDCINKNKTPLSGGKNALKVMRTLERISKSLR